MTFNGRVALLVACMSGASCTQVGGPAKGTGGDPFRVACQGVWATSDDALVAGLSVARDVGFEAGDISTELSVVTLDLVDATWSRWEPYDAADPECTGETRMAEISDVDAAALDDAAVTAFFHYADAEASAEWRVDFRATLAPTQGSDLVQVVESRLADESMPVDAEVMLFFDETEYAVSASTSHESVVLESGSVLVDPW